MNNTSPHTSLLAEPIGEGRIPERTLGYVAESAREELYDMVIQACVESGVTKATIAKRLGKDPAQITRILNAPSNWTIDTLSELLFAIDGRMLRPDYIWPMREAKTNLRSPSCYRLAEPETPRTTSDRAVIITYDRPNVATVGTSYGAKSWR